jgi:hypothetical protein
LRINTDDGNDITSKENYVSASFELKDSDENILVSDSIQIKGRGNSSWSQPKKPYSIKLSEKKSILEMEKSKKYVLVANYSDKTLLRNRFASYLGTTILTNMKWNPSFKAVELILNGEYKGSYIIGEKIEIDDNRVNIKKKSGGFICEINARMDEDFNFKTTQGICVSLKDSADDADTTKIQETVQKAEDVLYSDGWLNENDSYTKYFDVPSLIDWFIANELTKNNDACYFSSVYIYYDPTDKKIHMGPNWDFDISCGNINYNGCDNPEGFWIKNSGWHKRFFSDDNFAKQVKNRWDEIKTKIHDDAINSFIQTEADKLSKSAELNFRRYPILGKYVWPNAGGYASRKTYQSEIDYMIDFLNARYKFLDDNL